MKIPLVSAFLTGAIGHGQSFTFVDVNSSFKCDCYIIIDAYSSGQPESHVSQLYILSVK